MKHVLAVTGFLTVFFLLCRDQVLTWPYYYDEADYLYAVSLGLQANYTDSPAQSLAEYIRTGLSASKDRAAISAQIRASNDVNFYRHWHGPLYCYWLLALAPAGLTEYTTRSLSYVFPVLTFLVIYFGCLWLLPAGEGFLAALLSSAFYLWSYATVRTNEIAPHALFVLCYLVALVLLMKWRSTGSDRYWYGAVMAAACAFCTLEVAFVLILVMLACAAMDKKHTDARWMGKSLLLFGGSVMVLWPAAVVKLTFIKAYLFMAYLALFRKSAWGNVTFLETWRLRLTHSPWEWVLLGVSLVLYYRFCATATRRLLFPVLLYAGLMFLAVLRVNTDTPRYVLPYLPALHVVGGFVFADVLMKWRPIIRAVAASGLCALLLWNTTSQILAHPILPAPRLAAVLAALRERDLEGKKLLAPQADLPMIHYYLPKISIRGYADQDEQSALLASEHFDAVLYPSESVKIATF